MELIIEILSGKRTGKKIILPEVGLSKNKETKPYILETEAFTLHLELEKFYDEIMLSMDDSDYYFFYKGVKNNLFQYILMPKIRGQKGYEALFYNYFGIASLEIKIILNGNIQIISFIPVEVLARKLTAEQAAYMVEYILRESEGDLYSCFSATRLNSNYSDGSEQPKKVLSKLIKSIQTLEEILPHIINKPLTCVTSETRMQNGYQTTDIDEQSLAWLNENLSVLGETDDLDRAHVYYDGSYYLAREIQASVIIEHTDIYENKILYSFLLKLKCFAIELEEYLSKSNKKTSNLNEEGYSSFFSVMGDWISKANGMDVSNAKNCNLRITRLIYLLEKRISISIIDGGIPVLTQKAKSNRFYASVFRVMIEWYRFNKIDWRSQEMLLAIKSIPVLFEYYTVLRVRAELKLIGNTYNISTEEQTIHSCSYKNYTVKLYYQPYFWMVGHEKSKNSKYLRTEIGEQSFLRTAAGNGFKPYSHKHGNRVPDIVIELNNNSGEGILLILDAKYSTMEIAFRDYLRDCGMKYIHGIHRKNGKSPVQAMILICPAQEKITLADMHAPPYGLFDNKTVFPVLGVQAVGLTTDIEKQSDFTIGKTIKYLLDSIEFSS
ncbi:MAG: DUF2357 domain-containing protein [Methylococcales bacterium]|nr:DUF2357 domain-containing protein [Methylococcales bacterium]